jgi:hypothetical protein
MISRSLLFALVLISPLAFARSDWMNPGTMGANAVPGFAVEPPWHQPYTSLQFGAQLAQGWRYDTSLLPYWRLVTPFGKYISTYFEGSIVELWWSSPQTREEWLLPTDKGVAKADLRFGFKILLADFGEALPKIGFRAFTKSTTGKGYVEVGVKKTPSNSPSHARASANTESIGVVASRADCSSFVAAFIDSRAATRALLAPPRARHTRSHGDRSPGTKSSSRGAARGHGSPSRSARPPPSLPG